MLPPKTFDAFWNMLRSSIIGTVIGILPGMGGGPAGMIATHRLKNSQKDPKNSVMAATKVSLLLKVLIMPQQEVL